MDDNYDNFMALALKNLPKGKTELSKGSSDHWELSSDGTFRIESYETVQQTETLAELEIDPMNPTVTELINLPNKSKGTVSKRTNEPSSASNPKTVPKKHRID